MAALLLVANSGSQALAAATAETVLQLVAPTNQRLRIQGFSITVAGTSPVDLTVRVVRQTTAGTSGTAVTPIKLEPGAAETIQTTAATNFSAEPTSTDVLEFKRLQGSFEKLYPLGQELIIAGGGRIGIECTCTAIATVAAEIRFEE
jgi:hypothetical protein